MTGGEIAVLVAVCVAFAAAVTAIIIRKTKGKGGCCDCSSCALKSNGGCPHCSGAEPPKQK